MWVLLLAHVPIVVRATATTASSAAELSTAHVRTYSRTCHMHMLSHAHTHTLHTHKLGELIAIALLSAGHSSWSPQWFSGICTPSLVGGTLRLVPPMVLRNLHALPCRRDSPAGPPNGSQESARPPLSAGLSGWSPQWFSGICTPSLVGETLRLVPPMVLRNLHAFL